MAFTPLAGIVVLDLSRYLPGPFLTRVLCDLGARVIKVEPPMGDNLRWMPPLAAGDGGAFAALHAGKESVVLDLKKPEAIAVMRAMAARADVLVESNRPGVLDRLGLGWGALRAINPRLILASLSGYGQTGAMRQAAGHDINYVARSGILGQTGPHGQPPPPLGSPIGDVAGGSWPAAVAILGALMERERTGLGRHLDVALARGAFALNAMATANAAAGVVETAGQGLLTGALPCYRCYATADGRAMAVGALEAPFWTALVDALGLPHLAPLGLDAGPDGQGAAAEIAAVFASRTQAHWVEALAGLDACCEPVVDAGEALADPLFASMVDRSTGTVVIRPDLGVSDRPPLAPAPALGAHADAVMSDLAVPEDLVADALAAGALRRPT
jgi:crotonobetainyl-CoA:carnitine CoA-transferase CaiB-like acyl-CoA transferase